MENSDDVKFMEELSVEELLDLYKKYMSTSFESICNTCNESLNKGLNLGEVDSTKFIIDYGLTLAKESLDYLRAILLSKGVDWNHNPQDVEEGSEEHFNSLYEKIPKGDNLYFRFEVGVFTALIAAKKALGLDISREELSLEEFQDIINSKFLANPAELNKAKLDEICDAAEQAKIAEDFEIARKLEESFGKIDEQLLRDHEFAKTLANQA